jgi:hypothetical protein
MDTSETDGTTFECAPCREMMPGRDGTVTVHGHTDADRLTVWCPWCGDQMEPVPSAANGPQYDTVEALLDRLRDHPKVEKVRVEDGEVIVGLGSGLSPENPAEVAALFPRDATPLHSADEKWGMPVLHGVYTEDIE